MVQTPWRLLALPPLDRGLLEALFANLPVDVNVPAERSTAAVVAAAGEADLLLGDWSGELQVDAEVIAAAHRLAFVQQPSAGVDTVDGAALAERGIPLANAGGVNAVSVAEWCVGASFALLRWLAWADREVRAGSWPQLDIAARGGGELAGRRVGIVGMGRIGVECARRYAALGADVAHWSRTQRPAGEAGGAPWLELDALLARSDLLVVVIALADGTRGLLDARRLGVLPPGAFVVNAARGGVLDEQALVGLLDAGRIAGAALDVFAREPLPADSPLRQHDRVLLSPHAGGATREAQGRLITAVLDNIRRAVEGQPVADVVNGVDPVIRRRR